MASRIGQVLRSQGASLRRVVMDSCSGRMFLAPVSQQVRMHGAKAASVEEDEALENATIGDILAGKGKKELGATLFCTTDDFVFDAVNSMVTNNVGALLVMRPDSKEQLAGIVTERDYLRKIIVQGRSSKSTKVGDIMTEENKLITVTPQTKILRAMELMTDNRIRHIPVVNDKKMAGMVSIGDVVKMVVEEHKEELRRLNDFIKGTYSG